MVEPVGRTLRETLRRWAVDAPQAPALLVPGRPALSFSALDRALDRAALALASFGLAGTRRVATVVPDGPELAVLNIALASVATSCPLNPAYQQAEFVAACRALRVDSMIIATGHPAARAAKG